MWRNGLKVFFMKEVCIIVEKLEKINRKKNDNLDILSELVYHNKRKYLKTMCKTDKKLELTKRGV